MSKDFIRDLMTEINYRPVGNHSQQQNLALLKHRQERDDDDDVG